MDPDELTALGLYDPSSPDAATRLELLHYVIALGATKEELITFNDTLPALAGVLAIRGGPALTLEEAAEQAGVSTDAMRVLARAAGFPDPEPGSRVFTEGFVAFASAMSEIAVLFGDDARTQWVRVLGSAMARVADAAVSACSGQRRTRRSTHRPRRLGRGTGQRRGRLADSHCDVRL